MPTFFPSLDSLFARCSVTGVFPVPPILILPIMITGTGGLFVEKKTQIIERSSDLEQKRIDHRKANQ